MKVTITEVEFWKIDLKDETFRFRKDISDEALNALADNISQNNLQNKVKLRLMPNGKYQIIAGWTRTLAVKKLGWPQLPAIVYENLTDDEALIINVIDNALREDLNDAEIADQVQRLKDKHTVKDIVVILGKKTQHIYDLLALAKMGEIKTLVAEDKLTLYHAVELNKFPDKMKSSIVKKALTEGWSVDRIKEERRRLMPHQHGESDLVWDAVQVKRSPAVDRLFEGHWESFLRDRGVPAPYGCEYTGSIPAREMKPPYVCPNEVEWAVLAPATYHYHQEEYEGGEVPIERRDAFAFFCRDCATRFFKNVKFHSDLEYHFPGINNE